MLKELLRYPKLAMVFLLAAILAIKYGLIYLFPVTLIGIQFLEYSPLNRKSARRDNDILTVAGGFLATLSLALSLGIYAFSSNPFPLRYHNFNGILSALDAGIWRDEGPSKYIYWPLCYIIFGLFAFFFLILLVFTSGRSSKSESLHVFSRFIIIARVKIPFGGLFLGFILLCFMWNLSGRGTVNDLVNLFLDFLTISVSAILVAAIAFSFAKSRVNLG